MMLYAYRLDTNIYIYISYIDLTNIYSVVSGLCDQHRLYKTI